MKILIIHQNFPGQFRHIARDWAAVPGWQVVGIGQESAPGIPGMRVVRYRLRRPPSTKQHPYLRQMEHAVLRGQAVARILIGLRGKGFIPDVILAHPGWGDTLYARDVFPHSRIIHFCEWYYGTDSADMGFDPEFPSNFDDHARVRTWNALHLLNLETCDQGVSPTIWQRNRHPETYREKIALIHEGINTEYLGPDPKAEFTAKNGITLRAGDPVITYVARNLEPYRGFHSFMRALEIIQQKHKQCHSLIVGGDEVSYGRAPSNAANWREKMLEEVKLDPDRTHFLGRVPYDVFSRVLQVSAAHIYLTYPFVLSWSILEAMASGCLVIGSRTPPVEEVLSSGQNGILADFFDTQAIAEQVIEALESPDRFSGMRSQAVSDIAEKYSRRAGLKQYRNLIMPDSYPEADINLMAPSKSSGNKELPN
nr:glycosyltransferase [Desulfobacula sp.]